MAAKDSILLARIDERVKTVFNKIDDVEKKVDENNKSNMHLQTKVIPYMMTEIKLLKQRPMGVTAFIFALLKNLR